MKVALLHVDEQKSDFHFFSPGSTLYHYLDWTGKILGLLLKTNELLLLLVDVNLGRLRESQGVSQASLTNWELKLYFPESRGNCTTYQSLTLSITTTKIQYNQRGNQKKITIVDIYEH